jgi:dTDP-4-amino-4,6-dideoxygalactose transaminase
MNIKFLDLQAQYLSIKEDMDGAIHTVLDSSMYILGPSVENFEKNYAEYCSCKYAVGLNSGTSALLLALKALRIGPGDEVITTANTFIATLAAIVESGATPVLVDADPETRLLDIDRFEAAITDKTKAVIPVHLYGLMPDMGRILDIAQKHDIFIVEDAAQAQGAKFKGRVAGSFGIMACFSFYPAKNLGAYGEAGAVVTSDQTLADRVRKLRDQGSDRKYFHDYLAFNERMDGIQGAVLAVKLKHLDEWNRARNVIADKYLDLLGGLPIKLPPQFEDRYQIYHQFAIECEDRNELQQFLSRQGVPTMIHYPIPMHHQKGYKRAGLPELHLPVTEKLSETILSLPLYPELKDEEIEYITRQVKEFFR